MHLYDYISYPSVAPRDACGVIPPNRLCASAAGALVRYWSTCHNQLAKAQSERNWAPAEGNPEPNGACSESKSGRAALKLTDQCQLDHQEADMWTLYDIVASTFINIDLHSGN